MYRLPLTRMRKYFILTLLVTLPFFVSAQYTVETVPNQRVKNGSHISNPDNILQPGTVNQIDTLLQRLEKKVSVEVAVVILQSIGDADLFEFSQNLFNTWGVGKKGNDNGLLLLMVMETREVRFHTGDGIEGALPDATCKEIQREFMVPEFKKGNYDAGLLAGLNEVARVLENPSLQEELVDSSENEPLDWTGFVLFLLFFFAPVLLVVYLLRVVNGRFSDSKNPSDTPYPELRMKRWAWLGLYVGVPLLVTLLLSLDASEAAPGLWIFAMYAYGIVLLFHRLYREKKVINRFLAGEEYHDIVEFIGANTWYWFFMGLLFPVPFFIYFFIHLWRKKSYRNRPRKCKQCEGKMNKLTEKTEDEYLTDSQKIEEQIRSVDYDVWKCGACGSIEMWFFLNKHSKYEVCPKCEAITFSRVSSRTLERATYTSSGKEEVINGCKACGHQKTSIVTIPQLVVATTSSGSSGSSFGGSSSGGSSWGGGRSSGGGASSSW